MRITQNTNFDTVRNSIHKSKSRLDTFQNQASTMKQLTTPSDDPVGSAKVLEIRTEKVNAEQFASTIHQAKMLLENTDHAISEWVDIMMRAKEIAISQSSGASSTEASRLGIAEEVDQLFQRAVAVGNTRVSDRYLFGGYRTDRPPFDEEGNYRGDDGQSMVEIARDTFIAVNVPGNQIVNSNPTQPQEQKEKSDPGTVQRSPAGAEPEMQGENVNLFDELQSLRIGLLTGDLDAIRNTLDRIDNVQGNLIAMRSKVGSRMNGMAGQLQAVERQTITNAQLSSQIEDADMAHVMNEIAKEETILRSALQSSRHLVQPTLMDFIK
jgi:flagellar hook-associated protein 3 FlgL